MSSAARDVCGNTLIRESRALKRNHVEYILWKAAEWNYCFLIARFTGSHS